jgi:hypothetical protein
MAPAAVMIVMAKTASTTPTSESTTRARCTRHLPPGLEEGSDDPGHDVAPAAATDPRWA